MGRVDFCVPFNVWEETLRALQYLNNQTYTTAYTTSSTGCSTTTTTARRTRRTPATTTSITTKEKSV
uniref:Uncharacterized protein n=1 Tax=Meloidogyne incognita TaxID=6306 RepID=A0A914LVV4_MELIC